MRDQSNRLDGAADPDVARCRARPSMIRSMNQCPTSTPARRAGGRESLAGATAGMRLGKVACIPASALVLLGLRHRKVVDGNRLVSGLLLVELHQIQTYALQAA